MLLEKEAERRHKEEQKKKGRPGPRVPEAQRSSTPTMRELKQMTPEQYERYMRAMADSKIG